LLASPSVCIAGLRPNITRYTGQLRVVPQRIQYGAPPAHCHSGSSLALHFFGTQLSAETQCRHLPTDPGSQALQHLPYSYERKTRRTKRKEGDTRSLASPLPCLRCLHAKIALSWQRKYDAVPRFLLLLWPIMHLYLTREIDSLMLSSA